MGGNGRVAVVTGTTGGIGTEIGRALAREGWTVALHGRDRARLDAVVADVRAGTGNAEVHGFVADLGRRDEVKRLAGELSARFPAISALVDNAAVVPPTRRVTPEGLEEAFAVNVVAPALLGRWLRPALQAGGRDPAYGAARVVCFWGGGAPDLDLDDLQSEKGPYDGWKTYCRSKNAVAALAMAMAERDAGSGVSWLATVPGLVDTPGMRTLPGNMIWFSRLLGWVMRTPAQGARTPVWLVTAPELANVTGKAYGNLLGSGWKNELKLPATVTLEAGRKILAAIDALAPGDVGPA